MEKLFAVYLGGKARGNNIEVHDVVFVVGPDIKATFPKLKAAWFGVKSTSHVDAWMELSSVDGHRIEIIPGKQKKLRDAPKLYFINVGSSTPGVFGENHDFYFLVCRSRGEAKARAQSLYVRSGSQPHLDNLSAIDTLLEVSQVDGHSIRLIADPAEVANPVVKNVYWPLRFTKEEEERS